MVREGRRSKRERERGKRGTERIKFERKTSKPRAILCWPEASASVFALKMMTFMLTQVYDFIYLYSCLCP